MVIGSVIEKSKEMGFILLLDARKISF